MDQMQERYDLLQMGANQLRDKAVAAVKGGEGEMEALASFLFYAGDLDSTPLYDVANNHKST